MAKDTNQEEQKPKNGAGASAPAAPPKKSKAGLFIILGVVLLLTGVGVFVGAKFLGPQADGTEAATTEGGEAATEEPAEDATAHGAPANKAEGKEAKKEAAPDKEGKEGKESKEGDGKEASAADPDALDFQLDQVSVNLRDTKTGGVVVQFWVRARDTAARAAIEKARFPIRGALIELIASKSSADLQSDEGKELLKREAKKKLDELVGPGLVENLGYFQIQFFRG